MWKEVSDHSTANIYLNIICDKMDIFVSKEQFAQIDPLCRFRKFILYWSNQPLTHFLGRHSALECVTRKVVDGHMGWFDDN